MIVLTQKQQSRAPIMKKAGGILIFLLGISYFAASQPFTYPSSNNGFTVTQIKGCAPLTISINATACSASGSSCSIYPKSKKDNPVAFPGPTGNYRYDQPGTYVLTFLVGTNENDSIQIEVVPNIQPAFDVYSCKGNKVSVKVTDTNYDRYFIDYHDGDTITVPSGSLAKDTHIYAASGSQTVEIKGVNLNSANNCNSQSQTLDVEPTLNTPVIDQLTVTSASQIKLDFLSPPSQPSVIYKLEIAPNNATTFQNFKNIYGVNTTVIDNLKTDDNYYCFRMLPVDYCSPTPPETNYSNIICSANFDLKLQSNINTLTWVTSPFGITDYAISKTPGSPLTAPSVASSLDDPAVSCNTVYAYQLTSNYSYSPAIKSISLVKSGRAFSSDIPSVIENTTAVVAASGAGVDLQWQQDPAFTPAEYSVYKSNPSSSTLVGKATLQNLTDAAYTTEGNFCYAIQYRDACNNTSPLSAEACPIKLTYTLQKDNTINLSWTAYTGWKNGVNNYTVYKSNSQHQLLQTYTVTNATTFIDNVQDLANQVYFYVVKATANDSNLGTAVSNTVTVTKEPNLFYPTAFTPDSQGPVQNEKFKVFGQYVTHLEMKIFNRWGELLFSTDDPNQGWDGTFKGNAMPEGTYAFIAKITDEIGRTFNRSGSVVLLRKN